MQILNTDASKIMTDIRKIPFFPVIPLLPIAIVLGTAALSVLSYRRVSLLEERMEDLGLISDMDLDELSGPIVDTLSSANPNDVAVVAAEEGGNRP